MRLHHVNVIVAPGCTDDVTAFYELLGLVRIAKPAEGVSAAGAWFLLSDGLQVHVSERPGRPHPEQHFALVADDFDSLAARLVDAGHPWRVVAARVGARRAMTVDPHGNAVEVLEWVVPHAGLPRSTIA